MRWVVFTNVYVAACGAALTAATYPLLGEPPTPGVAALVFCCTLVIYNLDRLVEPCPGDSEHERWVERHRKPLWLLTGVAAAGAAACAPTLNHAALLSLVPAGAIAVGYCLPVLPMGGRWRRMKELPGAKLVLIALVWTYATAGLPMLSSGAAYSSDHLGVLAARLLFIAAVALPFDLPDMHRDRRSGIATLPILLGVRRTRVIAIGLALLASLTGALHPWPAAGAVVLSSVGAAGLLCSLRADRGWVYFMVALDGMLLVQAAGLWITAGLR